MQLSCLYLNKNRLFLDEEFSIRIVSPYSDVLSFQLTTVLFFLVIENNENSIGTDAIQIIETSQNINQDLQDVTHSLLVNPNY